MITTTCSATGFGILFSCLNRFASNRLRAGRGAQVQVRLSVAGFSLPTSRMAWTSGVGMRPAPIRCEILIGEPHTQKQRHMKRATWNGIVLAEASGDDVEIVEGNVYFPSGAVRSEYLQPSGSYYDVAVAPTATLPMSPEPTRTRDH